MHLTNAFKRKFLQPTYKNLDRNVTFRIKARPFICPLKNCRNVFKFQMKVNLPLNEKAKKFGGLGDFHNSNGVAQAI